MAKFKHKDGGICEVFTLDNINRLERDKNYERIQENVSESVSDNEEEVESEEPLQ